MVRSLLANYVPSFGCVHRLCTAPVWQRLERRGVDGGLVHSGVMRHFIGVFDYLLLEHYI